MQNLTMEIRRVDQGRREIVGQVAPYYETSNLAGVPGGERLLPGCFSASLNTRTRAIPLIVGHRHGEAAVGLATKWEDSPAGLVGTFQVRDDPTGDETLTHAAGGYLSAMSVGFEPTRVRRGVDGVTEVVAATLHEVSLVAVGAYSGARVMAVRSAQPPQVPAQPAPWWTVPAPGDLSRYT
jgi:HK97 family phage prohead protease